MNLDAGHVAGAREGGRKEVVQYGRGGPYQDDLAREGLRGDLSPDDLVVGNGPERPGAAPVVDQESGAGQDPGSPDPALPRLAQDQEVEARNLSLLEASRERGPAEKRVRVGLEIGDAEAGGALAHEGNRRVEILLLEPGSRTTVSAAASTTLPARLMPAASAASSFGPRPDGSAKRRSSQ